MSRLKMQICLRITEQISSDGLENLKKNDTEN